MPQEFPRATPAEMQPTTLPMFTSPQATLSGLSKGAAERLLQMRERADSLHRQVPDWNERSEVNADRVRAVQRLEQLQRHPSDKGGHGLGPQDVRVVAQSQLVDTITAEYSRLEARTEAASQRWAAAARVLQAVEEWLLRGKPLGTVLEDAPRPKVTLLKNEDVAGGIERLRRRARELNADLHRIESSCFPSSHCKQRMRAEVEALATRGAPSVALLVEHDRSISWPTTTVQSAVYNAQVPQFAASEVPDTLAVFAWLHKDALVARLDAEIAAESDDKAALSHEDRQERGAEVSSDLLDVERQEAILTWTALEQGLPTEFRSDIHPLAILGARLVVAAPNGSGSSPQHQAIEVIGVP